MPTQELLAVIGAAVTVGSLLFAAGMRWGQTRQGDKAQDQTQESLTRHLADLTATVSGKLVPTIDRMDERTTETLRQVGALHQHVDRVEGEVHRIDKEQAGIAAILRWSKQTGKFAAPLTGPPDDQQ